MALKKGKTICLQHHLCWIFSLFLKLNQLHWQMLTYILQKNTKSTKRKHTQIGSLRSDTQLHICFAA